MTNERDDGYFKGSTDEAIRDVREDIRGIRRDLDRVVRDHENRLTTIETAVRLIKYLYGAALGLLAWLGVRP